MSDFREDGAAALEWAARYLERVPELPVLAQVRPGELSERLPASPPERAEPFSSVLRDLDELIVPALTNWQHPRFFAYFAVTASEPGILAELLAAALNQVAIVWRASPASTELELRTVDWVRQLLGLPEGWHGHIEDTASTSTLAALIAARHVTGRNVVVCSEHAHSSVEKNARMLGMELRKVAADDELRMRADGLELDDVAAVVATVGTTSFASVDPLRELAERAHAAGAWLHVDAAYAGTSWICAEERWSQDGVELADSLVINPHKWLLTPMDCSLLWTSRPDEFREAFTLVPEYLRTPDDAYSLSDYGPALGRRFRSLKLWAVLRCYGREGLQAIVREHVRLAQLFASWVEADPEWELVAPLRFSLVVFRRRGSDEENEAILERANASGEIFLSHTRLADRYVLRLAIGNAHTTEADVRQAWEVLNRPAVSRTRAVVFDLWETLIDFRDDAWYEARRRIEALIGISAEEFDAAWASCRRLRETGPIRAAIETLGWSDDAVEQVLELRREFTRRALVPREGAVETIEALRARGLRVGLITVCTEEVAELWPETPFAPLLEEPVFSSSVGMAKPEPEIYLLACERLGVAPEEAVFVGDGANDELAGAERVGMRAILIHRPGEDPPWPEVRDWQGTRITALTQLLEAL